MKRRLKNEMSAWSKYDKILYITLVILSFYCCYCFCRFMWEWRNGYLGLYDFKGQWQLTALTLKRVNPYLQIGAEVPAVPSIGAVPKGWGTSPWGLLLGNLFYPGYLTYDNAVMHFYVISIITLASVSVLVIKKIRKESELLAIVLLPFLISSDSFFISLDSGNAGMLCCCFVVIACMICDEHPYISGILLAFAMVKPQNAALVCGSMLICKRIKPVITAVIMVVVSFLLTSAIVKTSPIELVNEFLNSDIGSGGQICGLFDFLHTGLNFAPVLATIISMAFGIILTALMVIALNKYSGNIECAWFVYFIPCIITTFWSYAWGNDNYILILPCIVSIVVALKSKRLLVKAAFFFCFVFEFFEDKMKYTVCYLFYKVLYIVFPQISKIDYTTICVYIYNVINLILIVTLFIISIFYLKKAVRDENKQVLVHISQ